MESIAAGPLSNEVRVFQGMGKIIGNQPAPYRGLSGPPGPKSQKSLENVSRGLRPRDPKKSPKSPRTLQKHSPDTFRRLSGDFPHCPRDFFETFWGPGASRPGRHFRDFFGISGPRDLCKGRAGSKKKSAQRGSFGPDVPADIRQELRSCPPSLLQKQPERRLRLWEHKNLEWPPAPQKAVSRAPRKAPSQPRAFSRAPPKAPQGLRAFLRAPLSAILLQEKCLLRRGPSVSFFGGVIRFPRTLSY